MRHIHLLAGTFALALAALPACGGDDGSSIPCPDGMVGVGSSDGDLCIDALEVTNDLYAAFLNEHGNTCSGHDCMYVDEPGSRISQQGQEFAAAQGYEGFPVVQVTFHGAAEYCAAASAFLCPDAAWTEACAGPAGSAYPYGDTYDAAACNGIDAGEGAPVAAGSLSTCEGGVDGLFDISGNVYEWTDACADGPCLIRGGSFDKTADGLTCDASHTMDGPSGHREDLGLRCCEDPL
jgi:sulfatase modifying factor 1